MTSTSDGPETTSVPTPVARYADMAAEVGRLDGWMTPAQGARLFDAARRCPPGGRIVEIGSFRGKSLVVMASAAEPGAEIIAIDPHAGNDRGPNEIEGFESEASGDHEIFWANLRSFGVDRRIRHVREFSDRAHGHVDGAIDLLYVDGAHRYGPARSDIDEWGARVVPGGTMLIHDSFSSIGVTLAIMRTLVLGRRMRYIGRSGSLAEYRADLDPAMTVRLRNAMTQLAQLGWFARNVIIKVALTLGLRRVLQRLGRPVPEWPY